MARSAPTRQQNAWVRNTTDLDIDAAIAQAAAEPSGSPGNTQQQIATLQRSLKAAIQRIVPATTANPGAKAGLLTSATAVNARLKAGDPAGARAELSKLDAALQAAEAEPTGRTAQAATPSPDPLDAKPATPDAGQAARPVQGATQPDTTAARPDTHTAASPPAPSMDPTAPFSAPPSTTDVAKEALPVILGLVKDHAQAAFSAYLYAIGEVREKWNAAANSKKESDAAFFKLAVAIVFLPAGPLSAALGAGVSNELATILRDRNVTASLASVFKPETAKGVLDAGTDLLKEKIVAFAVESDETKTVGNFLSALSEASSTAINQFIDAIIHVTDVTAAVAYYNLYRTSLLSTFTAAIDKQVSDMLKQIASVARQVRYDRAHPKTNKPHDLSTGPDDDLRETIVAVSWKGQDLFAKVFRSKFAEIPEPIYKFECWITPDMQASAASLAKEHVSEAVFKGQNVPQPNREEGDRVVSISVGAGEPRIAIVKVASGTLTFGKWVEGSEEAAARTRGNMQIGGVDLVPATDVAGLPAS